MYTVKSALLSPAVNMQQAAPSAEDEQQLFESKFGEMAYQAFAGKYPDLVPEIVTFKILDSNLDQGTAVGAFILEQEGDFVYIPAVLSGNELKPFDLMYIKSKDIFLPLNNSWLEEVKKSTISSLGEGAKLPDTVATDVDIRNLIVPPTTGRYSYASYVSPNNKLAAEATEPLGRKLTKMALGPFPGDQAGGGAPGGGGGAPGAQSEFNPEVWATFVEQFQRTQGTTPGQALDGSMLDVETLSKMYKSHTKTWEMMNDPNAASVGAAQGMMPGQDLAQQGMAAQQGQGAAPMPPAMGGGEKVASELPRTVEDKVLGMVQNAMRSGAIGGLAGGISADATYDWKEVPRGVGRGAIGGALLGPLGSIAGEDIAARMGSKVNAGTASKIGRRTAAALGGVMAGSDSPQYEQRPGIFSQAGSLLMPPAFQMMRYASDHTEDLKCMIKHAVSGRKYENKLLHFLSRAPNNVKVAFSQTLEANPKLLKLAAHLYGETELFKALKKQKTAGISHTGGALYVADKMTDKKDYTEFFGGAAPEAFSGVLLRGYHFKDTRPKLNLAVQVQERFDSQNIMSSGIYKLFNIKGMPTPALVISEPYDFGSDDRFMFPQDTSRVKRPKNYVARDEGDAEPNHLEPFSGKKPLGEPNVERSREYTRVAILENGNYIAAEHLMGEHVDESALKGTSVYKAVLTDDGKNPPRRGKGIFVFKRGAQYRGSVPVEITAMSEGSDGVIRGTLTSLEESYGTKNFIIDPRSPINRPMKLQNQDLVIIPNAWKWVPLKEKEEATDYLNSSRAIHQLVFNSLNSMGVHEAIARDAGQSMYAIDGEKATSTKQALYALAERHQIHASAAEAMLKIASSEGVCRAYVVSPTRYMEANYRLKVAQGAPPVQGPMGGPPAMQPQAQPPMPPAMQQPEPSAVDVAFAESMEELQGQMEALVAQYQVLSTVQQRAQQIEAEQGGMSPDMQMQGPPQNMPQGIDPMTMQGASPEAPMPQDPAAMGQDPMAMQEEEQAPQLPIMQTEEPSAEEIASQVNPAFLAEAANLHETGAFDAGTIASLSKHPSLKAINSQYAASLEESVDSLGRSLLTLYMQEPELKKQLGDETFVDLETQLRDTFQGLGELVLTMTHNSTMLEQNESA